MEEISTYYLIESLTFILTNIFIKTLRIYIFVADTSIKIWIKFLMVSLFLLNKTSIIFFLFLYILNDYNNLIPIIKTIVFINDKMIVH